MGEMVFCRRSSTLPVLYVAKSFKMACWLCQRFIASTGSMDHIPATDLD